MKYLRKHTRLRLRTYKHGRFIRVFWEAVLPDGTSVVLLRGDLVPSVAVYLADNARLDVVTEYDDDSWPHLEKTASFERQKLLELEVEKWKRAEDADADEKMKAK